MVIWSSSRHCPALFNSFLLFYQGIYALCRRNRLCLANNRFRLYRYLSGRIRSSSSTWTNHFDMSFRASWSSLLYSKRDLQNHRLSREFQIPCNLIRQTVLPITWQFLECASRGSSPPILGPKPTVGRTLINFHLFKCDFLR